MFFDPLYFLFIAPAVLLALWAQSRIHAAYSAAQQQPAPLSGAAAARHILDHAGLQQVEVEMIPWQLTDHYDARAKVLRLSEEVYQSRSLAAVGIAAHESGHALQDAANYAPLEIRNGIVPLANIGSGLGMILIMLGAGFSFSAGAAVLGHWAIYAGIAAFSITVFFQLVNLPVEFNASNRAKVVLVDLGIVPQQEMVYVNKVLDAAALTYVAATLQAIMTLLYFIVRFAGSSRR